MASRTFNNDTLTLEREVVKLFAVVTIGASGAPTLSRGKGIASVAGGAAATATGLYTVTLDDGYVALLGANCIVLTSSGGVDLQVGLVSEAVATASAPTVVFQMVDLDGTPTLKDPASGDKVYIEITVTNAS